MRNINLHANPSCRSHVLQCGWTDGQADMTKLIFAFRNFVKEPKNGILLGIPFSHQADFPSSLATTAPSGLQGIEPILRF